MKIIKAARMGPSLGKTNQKLNETSAYAIPYTFHDSFSNTNNSQNY